jgi:hypothetical protein
MMLHDLDAEPRSRTPIDTPRFQLRYRPIFGRVFLVAFVVLEVIFWLKVVRPFLPFRPRINRILFVIVHTPQMLFYALLIAAIATMTTDLVFRLLVRPLMRRWYHPRSYDPTAAHPLPFQLGIGEEIREERPARRVLGRSKQPGTLVLTNRRVYFFPYAWDAESWSIPFEHIAGVRLHTPRRRVLGWVSGYPDHLVIADDSGEETRLILADPLQIRHWFAPAPQLVPGRADAVLQEA